MPAGWFVALMMISSVPTYSWSSIRIRREWRLFALASIGVLGAALLHAGWNAAVVKLA